MSKRTTFLRLGVVRIALALAVAGVGVSFVGAMPTGIPTPSPDAGAAGTSVESSDVGAVVDSDDDGGLGRNARISTILNAGTYTIEETTFRREAGRLLLPRARRFRAERRAIGGRAPVGGGARSATDAFLCWREAVERFARVG